MNVLVIVLDTVRPDSLGSNAGRASTPTLDRLAAEGVQLTNTYSEFPVTVPTRHALFAGIYTWTNRPWTALRSYDLALAELFQSAGYSTVAFSDSPFNPGVGLGRGFDEFHSFPGKLQPPAEPVDNPDLRGAWFPDGAEADVRHWTSFVTGYDGVHKAKHGGRVGIELMVDEATAWLERHDRTAPFFCWLDSFQPHEPWAPPAPYDQLYQRPGYAGRYLPMPTGPSSQWMTDDELDHVIGLYLGEVSYTDMHLARLFDTLDRLDLTEDTLVVCVSDHGQPFGDHGTIRKFGVPLYDELSKIVSLWRLPSTIPAGVRREGFAQTCDLLPTLCEFAGIDYSPNRVFFGLPDSPTGMDGVSLRPLLVGGDEVRDRIWMGAFGIRSGVRRGFHKFIDHRGEKPNELFDLAADPLERNNLATAEPDLAAELHRELWRFTGRWGGMLAFRDGPAAT